MKTITKTGYEISELKELFPDAFDHAFEKFVNSIDEIMWSDEIMDSMKAVFKKSGIKLNDWSISDNSYCSVSFDMNDEDEELTGQKAHNWLKDNLLDGANFKRKTYKKDNGQKGFYYRITRDGKSYDCPLTGYCADDDFIYSLLDDIKSGLTLKDAFHNLADKAGQLFRNEYEFQSSEEYFIDEAEANEYLYDEDGRRVD